MPRGGSQLRVRHPQILLLSRRLRVPIAMRAFYEQSLWIPPPFLLRIQTCTTGC